MKPDVIDYPGVEVEVVLTNGRYVDLSRKRMSGLGMPGGIGVILCTATMLAGSSPDVLLGQGCEWEEKTSAQNPSPRGLHKMAYDSDRDVTVLFGGNLGTPNDTWEWDGEVWFEAATDGPSARTGHAMAYDIRNHVTVLFGGLTHNSEYLGDTWVWDGFTWTERHPVPSPDKREGSGMAYDSDRNAIVLFGGRDANSIFRDTWEWNGEDWVYRSNEGPTARAFHAMAYDEARGVTVLFGGFDGCYPKDWWKWDGVMWTQKFCSNGPEGRKFHTLTYDIEKGTTVLFGGENDIVYFNDVWVDCYQCCIFDPPRNASAMIYDSSADGDGGVHVLFGGFTHEGSRSDTWELTLGDDCFPDLCPSITGLKNKCKYGHGRFKVRAKVVTELPEGTVLGLCLDVNGCGVCELDASDDCKDVTIDSRGKAKTRWSTIDKGDHCVIVRECPEIHRCVFCAA